jgi:predicted anti-sigma-YlaC factor YlaD
MISCRRASELTSLQLDSDLSIGQKLAVRVHRLMCPACRRFQKQLIQINEETGEFFKSSSGMETIPMPEESRVRIQTQLEDVRKSE